MRRSDVLVSLSLRFRGDTLPPTSTMFAAERGRDFGARGDSRQGDSAATLWIGSRCGRSRAIGDRFLFRFYSFSRLTKDAAEQLTHE